MSCNYCVGNCFEIFFDILRCFLYFPQLISLFGCPWITITIYIKRVLFNFKSQRFYHLIQSRWFFNPILLTHTMWNLSCINSHSWSTNNINIRCWGFWRIILVFFVQVKTLFVFNSIFINSMPIGTYWCSHINIFIFRVWPRNVFEKLHKHSIVTVTFGTNPFYTTFIISLFNWFIPNLMNCYYFVRNCFKIFLDTLWCPKGNTN